VKGAYYNEIDPYAAQWLRNLIADGEIAQGDVDERDIRLVRPDDLRGYRQCHFFAGIGGWSRALRVARLSDDEPAWTASVPCQPYSVASVAHGGAQGPSDERDLWPTFFGLVEKCLPPVVYGEQVASAIDWGWWDRAACDLESANYACAAGVLRADPFGHERKRLYWVADAGSEGREGHQHVKRIPVPKTAAFALDGDTLTGARQLLAGDYSYVLLDDGVSVAVERCATKGYGNAIVPPVAAEFIRAHRDR
jgi:DNA (cytosine-5)-methyltransferase 1